MRKLVLKIKWWVTGATWLDGIIEMRGMGRELWRGEDPDEYVRKLRENWD